MSYRSVPQGQGREREASGSNTSLPIQTLNILTASNLYTHFNLPISNQTDRKPDKGKQMLSDVQ